MDLFDSSLVADTVQGLRDRPLHKLHLLKRLSFMALSGVQLSPLLLFNKILINELANGAEAINNENALDDIVSVLKDKDAKIQASGANCLAQLAKHGFMPGRLNFSAADVVDLLAEMLKSIDPDVQISSLDCLSQLADKQRQPLKN
jgi:hypothetical protein